MSELEQFIDKYEIVSTLGRGSMGMVYKAKDPEIGRVVAIKTLRSVYLGNDSSGEEALQRFRQEARSAGKLRHPNIVTIFETGKTSNGSPYIVMEFIEGQSLESVISERAPLDPAEALHYLGQIASAVDYAHSQVVIHRDIKPSNVIVSNAGRPHLLDFGVAKLSDTSLTPAGTVVGTPSYMSPEQIRGEMLDGGTDRFSLAVMAFELFTGVRPFPGNDFTTVVSNIIHKAPLSFAEIGIKLPAELEKIFQRALAKEKEKRYLTALDFVDALGGVFQVTVDAMGIPGFRPGMKLADIIGKRADVRSLTQTVNRGDYGLPPLPPEVLAPPQVPPPPSTESSVTATTAIAPSAALATAEQSGASPTGTIASGLIVAPLDGYGGEAEEKRYKGNGTNGALHHRGSPTGTIGVGDTIGATGSMEGFAAAAVNPQEESRRQAAKKFFIAAGCFALLFVALIVYQVVVDKEPQLTPDLATVDESMEEQLPNVLEGAESGQPTPVEAAPVVVTAENLPKIDTRALAKYLSSDVQDTTLLKKALEEAGKRDFSQLREPVIALARHPNYLVRIEAMRLISQPALLKEKALYDVIAGSVSDSDRLVRGYAIKFLTAVPNDTTVKLLERRLKEEKDEAIQKVLRGALDKVRAQKEPKR